jgi:hypothetical protein
MAMAMFERLKNLLQGRYSADKETPQPPLRQSGAHRSPVQPSGSPKQSENRDPEYVDVDPHLAGRIDDNGPGKNVLIRNKYVREETGTHETLTILDDSLVDSGEEAGIDPYNTGGFDRSRSWDKRFRN